MSLFLAFILVAASSLAVADPEYRVPDSLEDGERGEYLPHENYKILGIYINSSSLKSIKETIGEAEVYKGHHTESHICYVNDEHKIEFTISSLGFGYDVTENLMNDSRCSQIHKSIMNGIGLKIGMKRSEVLTLLGNPSEVTEDSISYVYWVQEVPSQGAQKKLRTAHNIPSSEELWLDIYSGIGISFKNNVITAYSVHTAETY